MAFPASGFFGDSLDDAIQQSVNIFEPTDTIKASLWLSTYSGTPTMHTDPGTYLSGEWENADGEATEGPDTLTTSAISVAAGVWKFTCDNIVWTPSSETVRGTLIENETQSRGLGVINFGADKLVDGTLTLTLDATYGLFAILF